MTPPRLEVLLVEDSAGDARLVERLLERKIAGEFDVTRVPTAGEALKQSVARDFDVILLDLSLPDTEPGSLATLEELLSKARKAAVIVLTGRDDDELALDAVGRGAQDYLRKRELAAPLLERAIRYAVERRRSKLELLESQERYALAARGTNDGIWDWDLVAQKMFFSPRWKQMLGYDDHEIGSDPEEWLERVHPEDRPRLEVELKHHFRGVTPHFESEIRVRHRDGSYLWMISRATSVRSDDGKSLRMAGSLRDVTARKLAEEQLQHDALHDALTGLANRVLLSDRLEVVISRAQRHPGYSFALLFLDLDRFKAVNDSLGHLIGDQLLVAIGNRFLEVVRPGDTVARVGGDEFAILADDLTEEKYANRLADRICESLREPFEIDGNEIFAAASIGIAVSSSDPMSPVQLLRDADIAMYRAKLHGMAGYEVFDPAMHESAVALLRLENDLKHALERQELRVYYQPIVSLDRGNLIAFEALVRWQHPERGLLYPDEFVSVAEETGLILPLGSWVLREACLQMAAWRRRLPNQPELAVSVNLSPRQFRQSDLVEHVCRTLEETKLVPEALRLEITEGVIMRDADAAIEKLTQLRTLGVQIHIDDFGTGYSSLSYLHRLPTDTVKIDRSFVSNLGTPDDCTEIVSTIVALARKLGMHVTAEGLETADQVASLRAMSCEFGQGFFFSQALEPEAAAAMLDLSPVPIQ